MSDLFQTKEDIGVKGRRFFETTRTYKNVHTLFFTIYFYFQLAIFITTLQFFGGL